MAGHKIKQPKKKKKNSNIGQELVACVKNPEESFEDHSQRLLKYSKLQAWVAILKERILLRHRHEKKITVNMEHG